MDDSFLQWLHAQQDEALERLKREDPGCSGCAEFVPCPCGCGCGWCRLYGEMVDGVACEYEEWHA